MLFNHLQLLNLVNTKITDAGLKELKEMKSLRRLSIRNTNVTNEGVADLQQLLPNLDTHEID